MKGSSGFQRPVVTADGDGAVGRAGAALVHETADRLGLTAVLSSGLAPAFPRSRSHDAGAVVRDLAVMLGDGGSCLSDVWVLRDHPDLFGAVGSNPTAWRVIERLGRAGVGFDIPAWPHLDTQNWPHPEHPGWAGFLRPDDTSAVAVVTG